MTDFFYLHWHEDELLGVGYAPDDPALDRILAKPKRVVNWRPIAFVLKDGAFADYQANNLGLRLCSKKLMSIFEHTRAEVDDLQWLAATIETENGESRRYVVLHVPTTYEVLDKDRTIFAGEDFVVKACLDESAVREHCVLGLPGCVHTLIVATEVKEAIELAECTGVEFSRVPTNRS